MGSSLGRLALGLVGAAIGSTFGMPALGFSIGSAIGGFIFAPEGPHTEGPRLSDADVQASSLGKIISEHYGTTRAAGNVFWSGGLREIKTTEEVGGKGGGGATSTTYTYHASFAIAFGKGRAESLRKIWADGKLIYDITGVGDTNNSKYDFRFMRGNPDSTTLAPDPLIAESVNRRLAGLPDVNEGNQTQAIFTTINDIITELNGETDSRSLLYANYLTTLRDDAVSAGGTPPDYGFTPSYKEVCSIIFDDIPLTDFGNRIPNMTAEIVWSSTEFASPNDAISEVIVTEISATTGAPTESMGVDPFTRSVAIISAGTQMRRFSQTASAETVDVPAAISGTQTITKILGSDSQGDYFARGTTSGADKLYILDNTSLTPRSTSQTVQSGAASTAIFGCRVGINGARAMLAACTSSGTFSLYDSSGGEITYAGYTNVLQGILGGGPMTYGGGLPGDSFVYWISNDSTNFRLHKINVKFGSAVGAAPTVSFTTMDTQLLSGGTVSGVIYDPNMDAVHVLVDSGGVTGTTYRYDAGAEGTVDDPFFQGSYGLPLAPPNVDSGISSSGLSGGQLGYANGDDLILANLFTGESEVFTNALSGAASVDTQVYDPNSGSLFTFVGVVPVRVLFNRALSGQLANDLASVIGDVCARAGMTADEYDVSAVSGIADVRGYTIARPTNARKVLENLFRAFFVEGIESDWQIKFQPRSTTSVRTIEENEMGSVKGPTGNVPFVETRTPEHDLPSEVSMLFSDVNRDYQQGSAHYRRTSQPTPVMYSKTTSNIEMPLVLDAREARLIAERILFFSWQNRDLGKTMLPWTHMDLDPGDVVEFRFNDGRVLTDRIEKMDIGANFELEVGTARSGDPVYIKTDDTAITSSTIPTNSILTPAYAKMFVLDIPLLYDYHDLSRASSRFYAAVGSDSTNFSSADIYRSLDGLGFVGIDGTNADVTWGTVTSGALPAPRSLHSIDYDNTFTVTLGVDNGDLASTTLDEMVTTETNRCVVYSPGSGTAEIIQFLNVTANADGTYTFDTLVRGRRGTDQAVFTHSEGEVFIFISDATVLPQVNTLAGIGTTQYFKAVSRGSLVPSAPSVGEKFDGNDLKPYAPSYVRRTDDATDLTVLWNRRSRIGGAWNMVGTGIEEVAVNEDFVQYELYLLPNTGTALVDFNPLDAGTYELLVTTNAATHIFLAADLATASYTLADNINVAVYQLSAQIGRGFGRIVTLAP